MPVCVSRRKGRERLMTIIREHRAECNHLAIRGRVMVWVIDPSGFLGVYREGMGRNWAVGPCFRQHLALVAA